MNKGFTLIEVMVSILIFATAMVAFSTLYVTTARLNEASRNLTQAINDGRTIMEAMRDRAQSVGLAGEGGVTATYPQGTNLAPAFGLSSLVNEAVTATYSNPNTDPLPVTVQVSWQESGRNRSVALDTLLTRR